MKTYDTASLEARCKSEWDASPELRQEFGGDFECYVAFMRASDRGLVKIFTRAASHPTGGIVGPKAGDHPADGAILASSNVRWKADPNLRAEFGDNPQGYVRYSEWVCREGRRAAQ